MEKINILFYESSSGFGGSANALANLIKFIDRDKFRPILLVKNFGPQIDKINNAEIIKFSFYTESKNTTKAEFVFNFLTKIIPEAIKIYFILKKRNIKLVHINTDTVTGLAPLIASKLMGIHCIAHVRGTMDLLKRQKILSNWVDRYFIVNKKAYEICNKYIPSHKLCLVYDGIDLEEFGNIDLGNFKKEFNLDSLPLVGLVGRIVEGKGHKEFILAAKQIVNKNDNVKFVIIGDAVGADVKYYKEVKDLVYKENLQKKLVFTGWRKDLKNVIADLDISVQATTTFPEGFGLTIIESMALGKPVLATNIPGPSDIVIDGVTGFLVPPGNIKAMAEKITFLLGNPDVAKKMGEEGKKRVKGYFNIRHTVDLIQNSYLDLIQKNE